jgi:membrane-associated PAP2 superfamily phosphatase
MALAGGLLIGTVFALGQQARGAHFLSHDLTSAAIVWYVLLGLYLVMFARRAE